MSIIKEKSEAKSLLNNFFYLSLLQIASYVFPLITIPYLAKTIGVTGMGKIAFASAVMLWFQTIADWGFNYTSTRDVAKSRTDKEIVSYIFSNVLWSRVLLAFLCFVILLLCIIIIPQFKENNILLLFSFISIPGHIMFPDWFFQATERMKYTTLLNIISKLIFTISIFIFIKKEEDYILQPLLTSLGFIISGIIALYIIVVKWNVKIQKPNLKNCFQTIKKSTNVFINNLMPNLYNSYSVIILGFMSGSIANGMLDAGSKIVNIAMQFFNTISRTFFPYFSRKIEKHGLFARYNIMLAVVISFLVFYGSPFIIRNFFTPEFNDAVIISQIMCLSIVSITLSNVYGNNYLIVTNNENILRNITIVCSLCGFIMALPLIYFFGYIGAAINITLTRALLGFSLMYRVKQMQKK